MAGGNMVADLDTDAMARKFMGMATDLKNTSF